MQPYHKPKWQTAGFSAPERRNADVAIDRRGGPWEARRRASRPAVGRPRFGLCARRLPGVPGATICVMSSDLEPTRSHTPVLKKAAAGIVLVVIAALVLKALIGFVIAIFWVAVVVAVIGAVLWALKTLIW
jgi:hypothetical protein